MAHAISHPQAGPFRLPATSLDPNRIAAHVGTIAVNAVLLMLLLVPVNVPAPLASPEPETEAVWIERDKPKPRVVEFTDDKPRPSPTTAPRQRTEARTVPADPIVPVQADDLVAPVLPDLPDDSLARVEPFDHSVPLAGASLQALISPAPSYPPQAVRDGLTGTVELEILVGIDGRPIEVTIVRSSGHRVLDQAARRVVLARWMFRPAMRDGQAVPAIGRVPIGFVL
jgi:protein TonB